MDNFNTIQATDTIVDTWAKARESGIYLAEKLYKSGYEYEEARIVVRAAYSTSAASFFLEGSLYWVAETYDRLDEWDGIHE